MRKDTRKPSHTHAWGKGFDWVEKMYPDPNPGQVYLVPGQVTRTSANPYEPLFPTNVPVSFLPCVTYHIYIRLPCTQIRA